MVVHEQPKFNIVGSLRDREVACSTSDRQDFNCESCVWKAVSSHSSHEQNKFINLFLVQKFSLTVYEHFDER